MFLGHLTVKINEIETLHIHNVRVVKCPLVASISLVLPQSVFNSWLNKSWCSPQFSICLVFHDWANQQAPSKSAALCSVLCGQPGAGSSCLSASPLPLHVLALSTHMPSLVWEPQTFSLLFTKHWADAGSSALWSWWQTSSLKPDGFLQCALTARLSSPTGYADMTFLG